MLLLMLYSCSFEQIKAFDCGINIKKKRFAYMIEIVSDGRTNRNVVLSDWFFLV